jgi:hypothetical protein
LLDVDNNTIGSTLRATDNTGGGDISNNQIAGSLILERNCPSFSVNQPAGSVKGITADTGCPAVAF